MTKPITMQSTDMVKANSGIVLQDQEDNWGILYHSDTDTSFGINQISVFIWKQLSRQLSIEEIITKVKENCVNVPKEVEEDVKLFLSRLLKKKFISLKKHE